MARLAFLLAFLIAAPSLAEAQTNADAEKLLARAIELHQAGDILGAIDSYKAALAIAPDGTRSARDYWRSGFYHIARAADVPLVLSFLDWGTHRAGIGPTMALSGNVGADMDRIRAFYAGMVGRHPEQTSRVRLREEGTGTPAEGTIVRLSPAVDEGTRTLMVEAEIPNQDGTLRPGAFATADIVVDPEQTAILLPASAIVTFAGVTKVVTVTDGKAVEKRVQLGRKAGDLVVSTVLMSMGMMMMPPVVISTPFKILLFVLADGWHLVTRALSMSFG